MGDHEMMLGNKDLWLSIVPEVQREPEYMSSSSCPPPFNPLGGKRMFSEKDVCKLEMPKVQLYCVNGY